MRLAFIGWGAIAQTTFRLLDDPAIEVVAVATRGAMRPSDDPAGDVPTITRPDELATFAPDVVAEAASRDSVAQWAPPTLSCGADFIVSSVSALADTDLLNSLTRIATSHETHLQIQPGALAGVEALAAARVLGLQSVEHRIVKPPSAWLGTPAEALCPLAELTDATTFFQANAAETATSFPKNANVAMTTALAGVGPEETTITLVADPTASTNRHELRASGAFGDLDVTIANNPLPTNPKTSALAALSLVRAIQNRSSAIII